MDGMFPSWALPLWIIGAPTILFIVNYVTSRNDTTEAVARPNAATPYGAGPTPATR